VPVLTNANDGKSEWKNQDGKIRLPEWEKSEWENQEWENQNGKMDLSGVFAWLYVRLA
jgi:hypothetical protein